MTDYSLTKSRTIQWMIIILVLVALVGAYRYFSVRAATKINSSQNTSNTDGLVGEWSFNGADVTNTVTYATWNPSDKAASFTLSGGDKVAAPDSSGTPGKVRATIGKSSGKWYWEYVIASYTNDVYVGIATSAASVDTYTGAETTSWSMRGDAFSVDKNTNGTPTAYGGTGALSPGDVIGVALDMDAGTIVFYINNTSQGTAFTGLTGTLYPSVGDSGSFSTPTITANFGATALTYSPPAGYATGFYTSTPSGATDTSGSSNNGTLTSITPILGKVGQALSFDGSTSSVSVPDAASLKPTSAISYGGWVYVPSTPGGLQTIIEKGTATTAGYGLYVTSDPKVCFVIKTSGGTETDAGPALTTGAWHHIMVTYDSSTPLLYIDGASQSLASGTGCTASTNTGSITQDTGTLTFGSRQGTSQFFTGREDEIRIYNRTLSAGEVMSLYNFGVGAKVNASQNSSNGNSLVGQWSFNGEDVSWSSSTAGTATDTSGNSNTGTLTNMSQSTNPVRGRIGQALNFDGVNESVNAGAGSSLNITGQMTVTAWIYPTGWGGGGGSRSRIVDRLSGTSGYIFGLDNLNTTNGLAFYINDTGAGKTLWVANSIVLNKWQHVAITLDASKLATLYVDGASVGSGTLSAFPATVSTNLNIGNNAANNRQFVGSLDEVRVYSRALLAGEVTSLYNMGVGTKLTP